MEKEKEVGQPEEKKETKKEEKRDNNKKNLILCIISGILLIVLMILGAFFIFPKITGPKEMPDWGKKYYNYLSNFKETTKETFTENKVEMAEVYDAAIYDYSDDENTPPVLGLDPIVEENKYFMLVVLVDGEPKEFFIDKENVRVEILYNLKDQEYYYYLMYQENNQTHFIKLADYIKSLINEGEKYDETVVTNGEKITVDGKEILKVDTLFLEPEASGISFEYKPEKVEDLENNMKYYIEDVTKSKLTIINTDENGLKKKIDEYTKIVVKLESEKKDEPSPEPSTPPEEPVSPGDPDPQPDPHQCEYDYLEWIWNGCYDRSQLLTPGGCGSAYELNGRCYYYTCINDSQEWDLECADSFDMPGPGECPPGYENHEGYCFG